MEGVDDACKLCEGHVTFTVYVCWGVGSREKVEDSVRAVFPPSPGLMGLNKLCNLPGPPFPHL